MCIPKNNASWIKLNYQHVGYYRVLYSGHLLQQFLNNDSQLEYTEITHLIQDATAMFLGNKTSCDDLFKFMSSCAYDWCLMSIYQSFWRIQRSRVFDLEGLQLNLVTKVIFCFILQVNNFF